ncbi:MAG TPA: Ppx/GppA phosphatase family protein [Acidimicrobiales bacterium]|nr:Ppx/GppA phosphatase family protein [Acidimicrobiales bacterium]
MTYLAGIDCGTNSTRLLVADGSGKTVERLMRITRLGQGVDGTGRLAEEAVARTVAVLAEYRKVMDAHGVERVRMTATSAARDASNRDEFFAAATAAVGVTPELLGGEEEGRLSFLGATSELDPDDGPFLVADIGGGSTEFVVGSTEPDGVLSTDIGCVRITERFLHSDPPAPEELSQAFDVVRGHLDDVARVIPSVADVRRFVGLAGTVTTMAAVELGLAHYDRDRIHHFVLTRAAAEDVFRTLATESRRRRIHNPGLEEARADVIVGGAIIVCAIMRYFDLGGCLVSEADILDGLVLSLSADRREGSAG